MATSPLAGIAGSVDGQVPQYDPDGLWHQWLIGEIFFGEIGLNKHVPKVNDRVWNDTTRQWSRVRSLSPTLIPTLELEDEDVSGSLVSDARDSTFIAYLDKSVTPYKLAIDARWFAYGTMALYCKIFKGANAGNGGHVVAFLADQQGQFLTNNIPLENVTIDNHTNVATKRVQVASTLEDLVDNEQITAIVYSAEGHVLRKTSLVVENTGFIRSVGAGTKYVSDISVISPFVSPSDQHKLLYPINVPMQAFNMIGVVHYSDGSTIELPVDGNRFIMRGLERFVSSVPGQDIPLLLTYMLGVGEIAYSKVSADGKAKSQEYRLISTVQNDAYTVKLFGYPQWVDNVMGYRMKWFMMDLTREIFYDVTPHVLYNTNSDQFDPLGYQKVQNLSVRLNLKSVSQSFASYLHTQTCVVILREPGTSTLTNWNVAAEVGQSPFYGTNLFATTHMVNQNLWRINLASGFTTQAEWLENLYSYTRPLFDRLKEAQAPVPTHFVVVQGNNTYEYPIESWSENLEISAAPPSVGTMFVKFIRRLANNGGDLQLAVAGLPIRNV